jgi:hypothetical protein
MNSGQENSPHFQTLRDNRLHPAKRSTRRWRQRFQEHNHLLRYVKQGNTRATVLCGFPGFLLIVYFRTIYPKSTIAEVNAFLWNAHEQFSDTPRFYSPSQISRAEDRFGLSRKRGSTTARQALLPINLARREAFWTRSYPYGVADVLAEPMIDLDECAIYLESADRHIGKAPIGIRVREPGPYGHSVKWTLLMATQSMGPSSTSSTPSNSSSPSPCTKFTIKRTFTTRSTKSSTLLILSLRTFMELASNRLEIE